jgi:hypothetical protein
MDTHMTQAVERLLCKCKALSSNPILTKKKKKKIQLYLLSKREFWGCLKYCSSIAALSEFV